MKLGLWLRLIWLLGAYCGCGGSEFFVGIFPDGGTPDANPQVEPTDSPASTEIRRTVDASAGIAAEAAPDFPTNRLDAMVPDHDAGAVDSPAPAADSEGRPAQAGDASDEPAPPPPALCCMTPCSGSSPAPITCGNGPAWDCAAGSCADRACSVGAVCHWMGPTCTGTVMLCP